MSKKSNLDTYRDIWLLGSILVICSTFGPYVYDNSLIGIIQTNIPKIFDSFSDPSIENLTITIIDTGFLLLMLGAALCIVTSSLASEKPENLASRGGIRQWNGSNLEITGLIIFSSPVFMYQEGRLVQVLSFLGTEYSPNFSGLGIGYYLTWVGVVISMIAGRTVNARIRALMKSNSAAS